MVLGDSRLQAVGGPQQEAAVERPGVAVGDLGARRGGEHPEQAEQSGDSDHHALHGVSSRGLCPHIALRSAHAGGGFRGFILNRVDLRGV